MRDALVTSIVLGALPFALFNPFVGVLLWTWLSVMNPHRLSWGFAYNLPFAQAAAIATLLSLVIAHKKVRFPLTSLTATLIAFLLWINVTMVFAIHPDLSIAPWLRANKMLLMTLVALAAVRSEKQIQLFLWVFVTSVAFFGVKGGIFALVTGGEFRVWGPPDSQIADNNEISVALLMMIPLMAFLQGRLKRRAAKIAMSVSILLCALSVVASYSRGAFVGGCAMVCVLAIKGRRRLASLLFLTISIACILVFIPQKWWDRMNTITIENPDQSIQGRFNAWTMAWNLAKDRPIVGGGFAIYEPDVFARYAPNPLDLHSAHSIYFQILGEHGFVGLGLFLLIALLMWRTGTAIAKLPRTPEARWRSDLGWSLQVSMVGFLVGGMTVNIAYWDVYYFEAVLLVALYCLDRDQAQSRTASAPAASLPLRRDAEAGVPTSSA